MEEEVEEYWLFIRNLYQKIEVMNIIGVFYFNVSSNSNIIECVIKLS